MQRFFQAASNALRSSGSPRPRGTMGSRECRRGWICARSRSGSRTAPNPSASGADPKPTRRRPQIHANFLQDLPIAVSSVFKGFRRHCQHARALGPRGVARKVVRKDAGERPGGAGRERDREERVRPPLNPSAISVFGKQSVCFYRVRGWSSNGNIAPNEPCFAKDKGVERMRSGPCG